MTGKMLEEATYKYFRSSPKRKNEYIMHNANTTALTLTCAVIAAVLSLVLSLGSLLKAVVIISDLQSLKSSRYGGKKKNRKR